MRPSSRSVLLALLLLVVPQVARGASWDEALTPPAREAFLRAVKLYNAQLYAEAADAFREAYVADPAPKILFSLGQAHRLAGRCPPALDAYRAFLRTNPDDNAATLARENMALCPEAPVTGVAAQVPTPTDPTDQVINAPVPPPPDHGHVLTGVLLGTAGAGAIASTVFAVLSRHSASQRDASTTYADFSRYDGRADTQRWVAVGFAGLAVGCAGVAVWQLLTEDAP